MFQENAEPRDRGAAGGFAAVAVAADQGFAVEDGLIAHLADDAVHDGQAAQGLGEVGHGVPTGGAALVEPFEELGDAIGGLFPGLKLGLEFFDGLALDIAIHCGRNLRYGLRIASHSGGTADFLASAATAK